jgi:MFS family permease
MTVRVEETEMDLRLAYRRLSRIAYWVSQIGSPPLTGAAAALLIGYVLATGAAWQWAGFYMVATILLPCAYIIWLVRRGQITDFHLPLREERIRPLLFSLVTALVAWGILHRTTVPAPLKLLATVNSLQALLFFLITLRWKISLHCAAAAILSQLALTFFGVGALPLLMSVPLIAWSRVHLRRHTLAQTVAGACLGSAIVTPAVLFYL